MPHDTGSAAQRAQPQRKENKVFQKRLMHELSSNPSTRWQARQFDSPGRREAATEEQSRNNRGTIETFAPNSPRLRLSAPPRRGGRGVALTVQRRSSPASSGSPNPRRPYFPTRFNNSRCPPRAFLPAEAAAQVYSKRGPQFRVERRQFAPKGLETKTLWGGFRDADRKGIRPSPLRGTNE